MKASKLEVWAPCAESVVLVADNETEVMRPDSSRNGWWSSQKSYPAGTRYGFVLDEKGPFPDPRSRHQPDGIEGLSSLLDHSEFEWTDRDWQQPAWEKAVVYELHIGTFSQAGTFLGAIEHLEDLVRLGITHVEIMPCAGFPGRRNWGYDCVSISAANLVYGGPEGLKRLINACHERGLAVIIDVIYNHMGGEGNFVPRFGPYFTDKYPTPWGEGPNLDGNGSKEVREFFFDNALMWLREYHADGLRLDAIDKVTDRSPKHFLVELRQAADLLGDETGNPRVLIAESAANDPVYVRSIEEGGYGMHCQWTDDVHHSIHSFFSGERQNYYEDFGSLEHLVKALTQGFVYDGCYSPYREKAHGKSPVGLPPSAFLVCLTNHDQVGNRPHGERFHHLAGVGITEQMIASAFVLLSPFTPMIFMGEEWAASTPFEFFTDHQNPEMAAAVGKGRKEEFGGDMWESDEVPDPQVEHCFLRSRLNWEERHQEGHREMLGWYSQLLALRKENGPQDKFAEVEADGAGGWLRMRCGKFEVVAGLKDDVVCDFPLESAFSIVLCAGSTHVDEGPRLHFRGKGVAVIRKGL